VRRLTVTGDIERGGISVLVALLMVVLLGFAAISIDVARLYSERAQLQNAADASVLAIAQMCAKGDCSVAAPALAASLANGNALDGSSNVSALSVANHKVSVTVGAKETGGAPNTLSLFFARALGFASAEVGATSHAEWGTPSKGTVLLPLAIAECKFSADPSYVQVLNLEVGGCGGIPGGFGWIADDKDTKCSVKLTAGTSSDSGIWFSSNTGASAPSVCSTADISTIRDQTVLLPLYAVATGTGSGGKFFVKGFAAFHVTGYHFSDENWSLSGGNISNKSIRGYFVKFVSLSQALELGGALNYGTSVVRLTAGAS
jgi:hypothetical protein